MTGPEPPDSTILEITWRAILRLAGVGQVPARPEDAPPVQTSAEVLEGEEPR